MGQTTTQNAQTLQRGLQLYQISKQHAFTCIVPFLNSQLSPEDIKAIKSQMRSMISNSYALFNLYLSWLYKEAAERNQRVDNISQLFFFAKEIYLSKNNIQQVALLEPLIKKCLYTQYFDKAVQYTKNKKFSLAAIQFGKLIAHYPRQADLYFNKGTVLLQNSQVKESQICFLQALQINKAYKNCYYNLTVVYDIINEPDKQEKCIKELLALQPKNHQYKYKLGNFYKKRKRCKEALEIFKSLILSGYLNDEILQDINVVLTSFPDNDSGLEIYLSLAKQYSKTQEFYYNIGMLYTKLGKDDLAIKWLKDGLNIKQNHRAEFELSKVYEKLQMNDEMFDCYEKSLRLEPTYSKVYQKIGEYFSSHQHYLAQSLQFYESQAKYDEQNIQVYYDMGREEFNKGQIIKSIQYYKKAVSIEPRKYYSYLLLASSNCRAGHYDQALNNLSIASGLKEDNVEVYNLSGLAYNGLNKTEQAISCYQKAIELDPQFDSPYFNLALIYFNKFQYQEALKYFQKCININPSYQFAFYFISQIYSKKNQDKKAISYLQTIIQQKPTNYEGYFYLGNAYYYQFRYEQAILNYKIAYNLNEKAHSAIYNIGITFVLLSNYEQGQKWILRALQQNGSECIYQCGYGICLVKMKRYQQAIIIFYKIISRKPEYYQPYFHLGKALLLNGKIEQYRQQYKWIFEIKDQTYLKYQSFSFFYYGTHNLIQFFLNFNKTLDILKNELVNNKKDGKRKICKFINQFISHLDAIIRDYYSADLLIFSGIMYRDIGDKNRAKSFFKQLLQKQGDASLTLKQNALKIHEEILLPIKKACYDYYIFLLDFVLQQLLLENKQYGFSCFKVWTQLDPQIKERPNIVNIIYRMRMEQLEYLRVIIESSEYDFTLRREGTQLKRVKISFNDIVGQIQEKVKRSNDVESQMEEIQSTLNVMRLFLKDYPQSNLLAQLLRELQIYQKDAIKDICRILSITQGGQAQKQQLLPVIKQYWQDKLSTEIAIIVLSLYYQIISLQQSLLIPFQEIVKSIWKQKIRIYQIFTQIDDLIIDCSSIKLVNIQNFLYDKKDNPITLQSSVLYEDYDYIKTNTQLKSKSHFSKSVESKLSSDIIQPKQKVNKQSLASLSGIQPYDQENIFQRPLIQVEKKINTPSQFSSILLDEDFD